MFELLLLGFFSQVLHSFLEVTNLHLLGEGEFGDDLRVVEWILVLLLVADLDRLLVEEVLGAVLVLIPQHDVVPY